MKLWASGSNQGRPQRRPSSDPATRLLEAADRLSRTVEEFSSAEQKGEPLQEKIDAMDEANFHYRRVRAGNGG